MPKRSPNRVVKTISMAPDPNRITVTEEQLRSLRTIYCRIPEAQFLRVRQYAKSNECSTTAAVTALLRKGLDESGF